ncbi:MAG TPA: helix-turn-helix transcriptional regulator [Actinoplanes sp.]
MSPAQQENGSGGGPTALRIQLGSELRRLRKKRGLTRENAGWEIRASESKISRMELGRVPFKERDVADLLTLYRVDDQDRLRLLDLVRRANEPGWWHRFSDIAPPWFLPYLGLEEAASLIRTYEVHFVPGLLQTPDYTRAVIRLGHAHASAAEIDRRTELRQMRQDVLRRPSPPHLWAVIDEAVLRRPVGDEDIMRGQIEALIEASLQPQIRLQIIPFRAGGVAPDGCPFAILRFAEAALSDVVYVEQLTSAMYLDKPADVDHYVLAMDHACLKAEPPDRTADVLAAMLPEVAAPIS